MLLKIGIFLIAVAVVKIIVSAIIHFRQRKDK
nr:MAG TPA: hypothetical protein [Caudoviricetes sp.]DAW50740.1 MAG TPA: hypothetical protein [Caudoviricetes sp.]